MKEHLENLEEKLDELIRLCAALNSENKSLRERETDWMKERRKLMMKNESARSKVEAMITRLKSMEQTD